jgi:cytochrome c553
MKMKTILLASVLAAALPVAASGDSAAGKKKAEPCKACHGEAGVSVSPEFPNLAGQNFDYMVAVLGHYKNGKRKNEIMKGQAANLSVKDINDIAAYYAGLKGLTIKY